MRLVIDGRRLGARRTGVGRYLESLLEEWAVTGLPLEKTLLVLRDSAGLKLAARVPGLEARVVGRRWPGLAWEHFGLGRVLRKGDILFAPANLSPWRWRGPTLLAVLDLIQEVMPQAFPWHVRLRFGWRYRMAAKRASRIVVPSASTARDVERCYGIDPERIRVIAPGPDPALRPLAPFASLVHIARGSLGLGTDPFFLFVGKRTRRRNVPALLAAFRAHRRRHPSHRLVLAGPLPRGKQPTPEADARAGEGVIEAGHVEEPVLRGLLAGAIALVYPSLYEGFGLPVVEAMASGCPVITLRNSALVEVGGEAAWYVEAPTPEALTRAMHALADDPDVRAERVARGLAQAAHFPRAGFAEAVKQEIVALANEHRKGAEPPHARPTRAGTHARSEPASASP